MLISVTRGGKEDSGKFYRTHKTRGMGQYMAWEWMKTLHLVCEGEVCKALRTGGVWGVNIGQAVIGGERMIGAKALYITQGEVLTLNDWRVFFGSKKKEVKETNNKQIVTTRF